MSNDPQSLQRGLGRVEARVAELSTQIHGLRKEMSDISHSVETAVVGHHERISHLESFRRSFLGILSAILLSGIAAVFAYVLR
jgi:hypothetical protein